MDNNITIREWVNNWRAGKYFSADREVQINAGWYDWFCSDKALANRLVKMADLLCHIKNDFLLDNFYVWFKNNCPCVGPLYDDIRFEPMNEDLRDELYLGVCFNCKREGFKYCIFTARNDYEIEFKTNYKKEVIAFLNSWTADSGRKQ